MMNKALFYSLDKLLPRWMAILPYSLALVFVRLLFKLCFGPKTKVWSRNSTKSKTFVFGISDLDITVLASNNISRSIFNDALKISKRVFPFLGEAHFYSPEHLNWIIPFLNSYELKRDPQLMELQEIKQIEENVVEKFIFLQRMFFSDAHTLASQPEYRQQKWKHHLKLLNVNYPEGILTQDKIKDIILELINDDGPLRKSLDNWLLNYQLPEFDIYQADLGPGFKIIAPHKYLWLHSKKEQDEAFLASLGPIQKQVISRQIDWEIWGLYCQRHWMNEEQVIEHLARLTKVKAILDPSLRYEEILQKIKVIFGDYLRLSRHVS